MIEDYRDTDFYPLLQAKLDDINSDVVADAMSIEEFVDAFYGVFEEQKPAERYTIVKSGNGNMPFGKLKVRVHRR